MKTAIVTAKIDPKIKADALLAARNLGVSLSFVISHSLREFAEKKTLELVPNQETIDAIEEARRDRAAGKTSPVAKNIEELRKHLEDEL
jgi:antitoxin component of RelBE/YafQ-DinJ toxin-antitoxin module